MTVLSDKQIIERLGKSIVIDPFELDNVNTSSYDVCLGEYYYIEHRPKLSRLIRNILRREPAVFNIWDEADVHQVWGQPKHALLAKNCLKQFPWLWKGINENDRVILIPPKYTILAHTKEFIGGRAYWNTDVLHGEELPSTSMMKARSSFGRNFIEVCKCAGWGDVGYYNRWTMEITNNSRFYHIPLVVGRRISQIVFLETGEIKNFDYTQTGKYQSTSDLKRLRESWHPSMMLPRLHKDRDIQTTFNLGS